MALLRDPAADWYRLGVHEQRQRVRDVLKGAGAFEVRLPIVDPVGRVGAVHGVVGGGHPRVGPRHEFGVPERSVCVRLS